MLIRTLLAATALTAPMAANAQSIPGMDMGQHEHHAPAPIKAPPMPLNHGSMDHASIAPATSAKPPQDAAAPQHAAMDQGPMTGMDHSGMDMHGMKGMLGGYSMMRDASGTAWQPDSSPMWAIMGKRGAWSTMVHGYVTLVHDDQGGPRGDQKTFVASMFMGMGQRELAGGTLTLKAMGSLDPLMGKSGYPLLLATGETADGRTELVDRQHPHDAFMELSATYSHPLGRDLSGFHARADLWAALLATD